MLSVVYAECHKLPHYAECRYAECRSANKFHASLTPASKAGA